MQQNQYDNNYMFFWVFLSNKMEIELLQQKLYTKILQNQTKKNI